MGHGTFRVGDITAVLGDNSEQGEHRRGYNGVWSLTHQADPANLFVPTVAGLNFEHIFDGHRMDRGRDTTIFFEPRNAPMHFRAISTTEAELHQPPTPTFHLESWTTFTLRAPHYIDMVFRFRATQHVFHHDYIGLFWASYIHAPEDRSMYFRHLRRWQQLCTQRHNDESTVRHPNDRFDMRFTEGFPPALFRNFSPLAFDEPFFYGHSRNMTAIFLFDRTEGIRFTHSPSGGGANAALETTNPAWDFQYFLPRYEINREYRFRMRLAYRPHCTRAQILEEVETWRRTIANASG